MNTQEIAKLLGVDRKTVQRYRAKGILEDKMSHLDNVAPNVAPEKANVALANVAPAPLCTNCGHITESPAKHKLNETDNWCASCAVRNNRLKMTPELQAEIDVNSKRQAH